MVSLLKTFTYLLDSRKRCLLVQVTTVELFAFAGPFVGCVTSYEDLMTGELVSEASDMVAKLTVGLEPRIRVNLAPGDAIIAIHKHCDHRGVVGVQVETKLRGISVLCGESTAEVITELVPEGSEACGFTLRFQDSTVLDVSLRFRAVVSLDPLYVLLATLRLLNINSNVKNDALIDALDAVVRRVAKMHRGNFVSVSPLVATLTKLCHIAKKQYKPHLRVLWKSGADRRLALTRVLEAIEKLATVVLSYEDTEKEFLISQLPGNSTETVLDAFVRQDISTANAPLLMKLHDHHPRLAFETGATDRLLDYFIQAGDVHGLDRVASVVAQMDDSTIPVVMASFSQRIPAIRLAIASAQVSSLCWLMGVARLEPLNPPNAPYATRSWDSSLSTLEMVAHMDASPAKETMQLILGQIDRRRRFINAWLTLARRMETPATLQELLALVDDITRVQDLQQLRVLAASSSLSLVDQRHVFTAAANRIIQQRLVLYDDALDLFLAQLKNARETGLITCTVYTQIKWRAKKINVGSAPYILDLQEAVRRLQLQVTSLESHTTSLQHQLWTLHEWAVTLQRETLDNAQRQRIVSIVATVLSSFGGPLFHALANCLNIGDPTELLSVITGVDAGAIAVSMLKDTSEYVFHAGIEEVVRVAGGDPADIVELLRMAMPPPPELPQAVVVARRRVRGRPIRLFQAAVRVAMFAVGRS